MALTKKFPSEAPFPFAICPDYLSPSSVKSYLLCSLRFFFELIGRLGEQPTRTGLAAFIAGVTPVPQAAGALQTLIVGEHAPVGGAIAVLVVWAVVAFVVTVAAIKKRRQTSVGALRAELAA